MPMKLYISNVPPSAISLSKLTQLCNFVTTKHICEICSPECGLLLMDIDSQRVYQTCTSFQPNYELIENYNGYNLLLDKSDNPVIEILSQLPVQYGSRQLIEYEFKLNPKSLLSLLVQVSSSSLVPVNYWFVSSHFDLADTFFTEDFHAFLQSIGSNKT